MRQTTAERRRDICKAIGDKSVTTAAATRDYAWVFLDDRSIEVLDAKNNTIAHGPSSVSDGAAPDPLSAPETTLLSEIIDGIVGPETNQSGVWMMRGDGTLLYLSVVDGGVV